MKRRQTKRLTRKRVTRKRRQLKRRSFSRRRQRGGSQPTTGQRGGEVNLPVPEGAVVGVDMDPKDPYSVPILISKAKYENEILED